MKLRQLMKISSMNRAGAKTYSYWQKSNGKWKSRKADKIISVIRADYYTQNCGNHKYDQGGKGGYDTKKEIIKLHLGEQFGVANEEVQTNHEMTINGVLYERIQYLPTCN